MRFVLHRNKKRGFSLIEAAIVLGVVGVVIGGIWAAASRINESRRANAAVILMNSVISVYRQHAPVLRMDPDYTDMTPVFAGIPLPEGFTYDTAKLGMPIVYGQGVVMYMIYVENNDRGMYASFWLSDDFATSRPQPRTCLELTKTLLQQSSSVSVSGGTTDLLWNNSNPQPSMTEIMGACKDSDTIEFEGIMP